MPNKRVIFRIHAIRRMFLRGITEDQILQVIENGETIEEYPNDTPYPSRLLLRSVGPIVLHVVVGEDEMSQTLFVVTAYVPDLDEWEPGFRKRRRS